MDMWDAFPVSCFDGSSDAPQYAPMYGTSVRIQKSTNRKVSPSKSFLIYSSGTVSGTNMDPVFLFVFDRLNIDHYLTSSSSIDGKFHTLRQYMVEIGIKLSISYILRF